MARMKKISLDEFRKEKVTDLMNQFFDYDNQFKNAIGAGGLFIDVHEWQIKACDVIHEIDESGWLHIAKEMYPHEVEMINDYLLCYEEIKSGVRI